MPHPSTSFGEELRKRRLEAGLSLTDLSGLVPYSKAQLNKVERGIKAHSRDLARLCDAALGADGALIALGTVVPAQRGHPPRVPGLGQPVPAQLG
ncbi:helix-turn-helix domain-containing protein [Streptomyces sp. NPDC005930]|uniref:helix-turn-helix domain-containing protein n=1 Tax=Streptomyces sp. NPDC005930 TaxID=3364736 RepID=UPI0036B7B71F